MNCPDFGQGCRWHNGQNGVEDDLDWMKVDGTPDPDLVEKYTGTSSVPSE